MLISYFLYAKIYMYIFFLMRIIILYYFKILYCQSLGDAYLNKYIQAYYLNYTTCDKGNYKRG